jgi:hypothetical protein
MNGLKKAAIAVVVSGLGLASQSLSAAEEAKPESAGARAPAVGAYRGDTLAQPRVIADPRRVAHEARVAALRASSDQFYDWAKARGGYQDAWIEPWSQHIEAYAELQQRMLDPWGAAMIDHLKADSDRRLAAYGFDIPAADARHEATREWARQQQAAIYENARRFHEAQWKAMPKVTLQAVPVAPYGWPAYGLSYPHAVAAAPAKAAK